MIMTEGVVVNGSGWLPGWLGYMEWMCIGLGGMDSGGRGDALHGRKRRCLSDMARIIALIGIAALKQS